MCDYVLPSTPVTPSFFPDTWGLLMNTTQSKARALITSPVGKKLLTGITGLGLTFFVLVHMTGNLALLFSGADAYNAYSHFLMSLGPILYAIEGGLLLFFLLHAGLGINIFSSKLQARPERYERYQSAGKPSMQSTSSRSMIVTGIILLGFLIIHLISFKFGPGGPGSESADYLTTVNGVEMRDLAKLVLERFQSPLYTFGYVAVMLLLGVHLRHGIWSAFQSLGATNPRLTPVIYLVGGLVGLAIALGFIVLPLWIYFGGA